LWIFATILFGIPNVALSQIENVDGKNVYVVDVSEIEPCAILDEGDVTGFSVDLWKYCANELDLDFRFRRVASVTEKLADLANGRADVAIAGISWTEDREQNYDFSVPELNSGLRAMVHRNTSLLPTLSPSSRRICIYLLGFLLISGNILWWAERGGGAIRREYFPGILEAFWCVFATMSTVGYGDIAPKRWLGRLMAVLIMFSGISLFGVLAASLTADLIAERKVSQIDSVKALVGLKVATKEGTTSSQFLRDHHIDVVEKKSFKGACDLLLNGSVDAVVFDEPAILYRAKEDPDLIPVGPPLNQEYYAFAIPQNSPLREKLNQSLLKARDSGEYDRIYKRWFGEQ
jgi:polar amino acid transport system substrate-binding protein